MSNNAVQLFKLNFSGTYGASWPVTWLPPIPAVPAITPKLSGTGEGWAGQVNAQGYKWAGRSTFYPGRANYKVDLDARWKNASGTANREVGIMVRIIDKDNYLVARIKNDFGNNAQLRLFKRINGVETQLGATNTSLTPAQLNAGICWRVRVEDLANGQTRVTVYTASLGPVGNGTQRIDWTGTVDVLRGAYTAGVEVGELWASSDISVDNLVCFDFSDESTVTAPGQGATGWTVEIDDVLHKVNDDTGQLEGISPAVFLEEVRQGYGPNGNRASLTTAAFTGGIVRPNSKVAVFYGSTCVFRGRVTAGDQEASASMESTTWQCNDAFFISKQVVLTDEDGTGSLAFNITELGTNACRDERQNKTIGQVIQYLFDTRSDGNEGLRFYGAASGIGNAYNAGDLAAMDAVIPDLTVSNNFAAAITQLLSYFPKHQLWVDPATLTWRFRDVTALAAETIDLTSEWATVRASPDPKNNYTAVLWRGSKEEPKADQELHYDFETKAGTLQPSWTKGQEQFWSADKRHLTSVTFTITGSGNGAPGGSPVGTASYITFSTSVGLDPDDFRGAMAQFTVGTPSSLEVLAHTTTQAFFSSAFTSPPTVGSRVTFTAVDNNGRTVGSPLGANMVGRGFYVDDGACRSLRNEGWCGSATLSGTGIDGKVYAQLYAFKVESAGSKAVAVVSEPPKLPIGLVNFLPPPGSTGVDDEPKIPNVPDPMCAAMAAAKARMSLKVSKQEGTAPTFREPVEGYRGTAYSDNAALWDGGGEPEPGDWGVKQVYTFDDPTYTQTSQTAGLRKAAAAMLAVYGQKTYVFDVSMGTPWIQQAQSNAYNTAISRWHGLTKNVSLSSSKRTTTFEAAAFPMFEVAWDVRNRRTTVRAGTASGWMSLDAAALTRDLREAALEKKLGKTVADLADFKSKFLDKAMSVMPQQGGPVPACDVAVVDTVNRRTISVQEKFDDDQKTAAWLSGELGTIKDLLLGENKVVPGDTQGTPGATTGYVIPGNGQALGAPGNFAYAFAGPQPGTPNANTGLYGGIPGVQESGMGAQSLTMRMGNLAFRVKKDSRGRVIGIEGAPLATGGAVPTGGWQTIAKPQDVYALLNTPVIRVPSVESLLGILLRRDNGLALEVGARHDVEGKPIAPGDVTSTFANGAPPTIASWLRTPGHSRFFRMVTSSWNDPAGPVWEGPGQEGMWPGRYWRVAVPENVLVEVQDVGHGSGTNGGRWSPISTGSLYTYISDGYVVHKQLHGNDMEPDIRYASPTLPSPEEPGNPFGFSGDQWRFHGGGIQSGIGATIGLPRNGIVAAQFYVQTSENFWLAAEPAGRTHTFRADHAWRASAWGATQTGSTQTLTTDGTGTTTGLFMFPGGSVPPNLRAPNGTNGGALAISVVNTGGTATNPPALVGVGVSLGIIEGGKWLRIAEKASIAETVVGSAPWSHQPMTVSDTFSLGVSKPVGEGLAITEAYAVELNPPVLGSEAMRITDSVSTLII